MQNSLRHLFWLLAMAVMVGCTSSISTQEMEAIASDTASSLVATCDKGLVSISVKYRPRELYIGRDLQYLDTVTQQSIDSVAKRYEGQSYFILTIANLNRQIDQSTISMLSFDLANQLDIYTEDNVFVSLKDYAVPNYMTAYTDLSILLVLDRREAENAEELHFILKECGLGIGDTHIMLETSGIKGLPNVNYFRDNTATK